jgi:hypothetical protein
VVKACTDIENDRIPNMIFRCKQSGGKYRKERKQMSFGVTFKTLSKTVRCPGVRNVF